VAAGSQRDERAFGSAAGTALAAKFDLSAVPGMYDGRPDRFFDSATDPRRSAKQVRGFHGAQARWRWSPLGLWSRPGGSPRLWRQVEDSHITRNKLAADLLDFVDMGPVATAASLPDEVTTWRGEGRRGGTQPC
jgi:hypothetical protein